MQLVYDEFVETCKLEDFDALMSKFIKVEIDGKIASKSSPQKQQTDEATEKKGFVRNEFGENVASHHFALDAKPKVVVK